MAGVCQGCKQVKELRGCDVCGARICFACTGRNGCRVCQGKKMIK